MIDPKRENLMITAEERYRLGHDAKALEPKAPAERITSRLAFISCTLPSWR